MGGRPARTAQRIGPAVRDTKYSPLAKKISVTADKIVCRVSNVDITARSCELTFNGARQTITGRRASEIFATEAMAGVPADGAAGSVLESLSKLNCTLDPAAIRLKAGGGASCSFETGN
ncbi:hypothetical protein [Bradyrhizobium sp. AZCC 1693]|uniref:hypothetical protein n=1 Tax=Bradyrhizobium sp. AZCC 1693 TaxID=3117029 RepID=UPI002FF02699